MKTPQLILGIVFLVLGAWGLLAPQPYMEPPPVSNLLLQETVSVILISLGLFVLFVERIVRLLGR